MNTEQYNKHEDILKRFGNSIKRHARKYGHKIWLDDIVENLWHTNETNELIQTGGCYYCDLEFVLHSNTKSISKPYWFSCPGRKIKFFEWLSERYKCVQEASGFMVFDCLNGEFFRIDNFSNDWELPYKIIRGLNKYQY